MTDQLPPRIQAIADRLADNWGETIEVGPGWYDLLARLDTRLAELSPGYVLEQCKSKYGTLRFYARPHDPDDSDGQITINEIIRVAEDESATICEECGAPARQISVHGWIRTVCPKHASESPDPHQDDFTDVGDDGLPHGRDCPSCGQPLEPGHIDSTLALIRLCPAHGPVAYTTDPFSEPL